MCRLLAELTNTDLRLMTETIKRLEQRAGLPAVDIRLTADIHAQIHLKVRSLGLDPHDTHPQELFVSLQNMAATHEGFLKKKFNFPKQSSADELAGQVSHVYERLRFNRRSWLLRPAALRRLFKEQPPKALIKALGYRSADSMIKREPADVLMFLTQHIESATWQQQFDKQLAKLSAIDFEERLLEVKTLTDSRYKDVANKLIAKHHSLVFGVPLAGTLFVLPATSVAKPGMLLLTLLMALREATELQYTHSHLRHHQMEGAFGQKVVKALRHAQRQTVSVAGQPFDWHLLHRHYGTAQAVTHPLIFQPHLQAEDLAYRRAEEILYRLEPALHFWHGTEYVGLKTNTGVISFNLIDVLVNLANGVSLQGQHNHHLKQAVWDELLLRYLQQPAVEQAVLSGLVAHQTVHDTEFV